MTKKPMNSLFLNYLIESENFIETNVEKWLQDLKQDTERTINEVSEATNAHIVLMMACLGEIGWCLPKWKGKNVKLGNIFKDLKESVHLNEIDEKLAGRFIEPEIEALVLLIDKQFIDSEKAKLDVALKLYSKQEYFTCAVLLAGLIDSVSINQVLKTNANVEHISQCWKCY